MRLSPHIWNCPPLCKNYWAAGYWVMMRGSPFRSPSQSGHTRDHRWWNRVELQKSSLKWKSLSWPLSFHLLWQAITVWMWGTLCCAVPPDISFRPRQASKSCVSTPQLWIHTNIWGIWNSLLCRAARIVRLLTVRSLGEEQKHFSNWDFSFLIKIEKLNGLLDQRLTRFSTAYSAFDQWYLNANTVWLSLAEKYFFKSAHLSESRLI